MRTRTTLATLLILAYTAAGCATSHSQGNPAGQNTSVAERLRSTRVSLRSESSLQVVAVLEYLAHRAQCDLLFRRAQSPESKDRRQLIYSHKDLKITLSNAGVYLVLVDVVNASAWDLLHSVIKTTDLTLDIEDYGIVINVPMDETHSIGIWNKTK